MFIEHEILDLCLHNIVVYCFRYRKIELLELHPLVRLDLFKNNIINKPFRPYNIHEEYNKCFTFRMF